MNDTFSATLNYFSSLPNWCSDNSTAVEPLLCKSHLLSVFTTKTLNIFSLDVGHNAPPSGENMMQLCKLHHNVVYVGETVKFSCHGSYYYFSGGFRWLLKSKDKPPSLSGSFYSNFCQIATNLRLSIFTLPNLF